MHSLTPQRLHMLLGSPEAQRLSAPAQERLRWIAAFVLSGDSISETCEKLGIARSTFHRWLDRFDPNDLTTLEERAHEPLHPRVSTVSDETVNFIRSYRERSPLMGKERIRELLMAEHGMDVSASTIGRVIERECLYFGSTPLHWRKRMRRQQPVRPMQETPREVSLPLLTPTTATAAAASCTCAWCRLTGPDGRNVRRFLGMASLLINVVMLGMFLGTALWEKKNETVKADLFSSSSAQIFSSVSPHDGR